MHNPQWEFSIYKLHKNIRYEGWWLNDFDDQTKKRKRHILASQQHIAIEKK